MKYWLESTLTDGKQKLVNISKDPNNKVFRAKNSELREIGSFVNDIMNRIIFLLIFKFFCVQKIN